MQCSKSRIVKEPDLHEQNDVQFDKAHLCSFNNKRKYKINNLEH